MKGLLPVYGSLLLLPGRGTALVLMLATLVEPRSGTLAWVGAAGAMLADRLLPLPPVTMSLVLVNALLTGHLLAASFAWHPRLLLLLLLSGVLCRALCAWLEPRLRPTLCLPFVLASWAGLALGKSLLWSPAVAPQLPVLPLPLWCNAYLSALGGVYLVPNALSGLLVLGVLLYASPALAALSLAGYATCLVTLLGLGVPALSLTHIWAGTQAILTALMVGGLWMVPSRASLALAVLASASSGLMYLVLVQLQWLPLALPFLLITWACLHGLRLEGPGLVRLALPSLPEQSWQRATLASARGLRSDSLALRLPFVEGQDWQVYQAFEGAHTHQGLWRHAVDFYRTQDGRSFLGQGLYLSDYLCFGAPVLSPVTGCVVQVCSDVPDNPPGEVHPESRWGNYVLIAVDVHHYVMLAHLQQDSLQVVPGQAVAPGHPLARCGNSGRSPQPHLHVHVQSGPQLGAPTRPWHFSHVLAGVQGNLQLDLQPRLGQTLCRPRLDRGLAEALHFPVGRQFHYTWQGRITRLEVQLDLLGQFWLESDSGARVALIENAELLAAFDRQGPADPLLDLWILALGLTPFYTLEGSWSDRPPANLLGHHRWTPNLHSHYHRELLPDGQWLQVGRHGIFHTRATLHPRLGCTRLELQGARGLLLGAELHEVGLRADQGIPAWSLRPRASAEAALA